MDLSLSEEQRAVQTAVREWVDAVVVPGRAAQRPRGALPAGGARRAARDRLHRHDDPGGVRRRRGRPADVLPVHRGARPRRRQRALDHVACTSAWSPARSTRWGTEEQKQQWLPRMATGEVLGCFGLTEPDHGSNPADLQRHGDELPGGGWRINGAEDLHHQRLHRRGRAGHGPHRRTGRARASRRSWCRPTRPASAANPIHGKLGLRSCDTAELVLDDVGVGPRRAARRRGRRHQGRAVGARRRPDVDRRLVHRDRRRPRSTRWSPTRPSASSSASRSPATSWCRS